MPVRCQVIFIWAYIGLDLDATRRHSEISSKYATANKFLWKTDQMHNNIPIGQLTKPMMSFSACVDTTITLFLNNRLSLKLSFLFEEYPIVFTHSLTPSLPHALNPSLPPSPTLSWYMYTYMYTYTYIRICICICIHIHIHIHKHITNLKTATS